MHFSRLSKQLFLALVLAPSWSTAQHCPAGRESVDDFGILLGDLSNTFCLDSDPVPRSIFAPSKLNLWSAPTGFIDLGAGHYVYGRVHSGSLYVFEKDDGSLGAIMVDAPIVQDIGNLVKDFLASIGAVLEVLIVTHDHYDHAGKLNVVLAANPTLETFITSAPVAHAWRNYASVTFGNARLNEIFSNNPDFPQYEFDVEIEDRLEYTIGNQTLDIRVVEGHVDGNLLIWHEASSTLTNIDSAVFPKWSPFFALAQASNAVNLLKLFDVYREYPYKYFVTGHLTHVGTPEDVALSEEYIVDIVDASFRAFVSTANNPSSKANWGYVLGVSVNINEGPNAGNVWKAQLEYREQITNLCIRTVLDPAANLSGKNWAEVLGGVRATLHSHCMKFTDTLRLDAPGSDGLNVDPSGTLLNLAPDSMDVVLNGSHDATDSPSEEEDASSVSRNAIGMLTVLSSLFVALNGLF